MYFYLLVLYILILFGSIIIIEKQINKKEQDSYGRETSGPLVGYCPHSQNLSHGKKELRHQMELSLLISWPENGEMILDYPGGLKVITGSLKK